MAEGFQTRCGVERSIKSHGYRLKAAVLAGTGISTAILIHKLSLSFKGKASFRLRSFGYGSCSYKAF